MGDAVAISQSALNQTAKRVVHAPVVAEGDTPPDHSYGVLIAGFRCLELESRAVTDRVWIGRVLEVIDQFIDALEVVRSSNEKCVCLHAASLVSC